MNDRIILAVEPDTGMAFGPAYAKAMKLPFRHGWDHYEVFERRGKDLIHVSDASEYGEARQLLQ